MGRLPPSFKILKEGECTPTAPIMKLLQIGLGKFSEDEECVMFYWLSVCQCVNLVISQYQRQLNRLFEVFLFPFI